MLSSKKSINEFLLDNEDFFFFSVQRLSLSPQRLARRSLDSGMKSGRSPHSFLAVSPLSGASNSRRCDPCQIFPHCQALRRKAFLENDFFTSQKSDFPNSAIPIESSRTRNLMETVYFL